MGLDKGTTQHNTQLMKAESLLHLGRPSQAGTSNRAAKALHSLSCLKLYEEKGQHL